MTVRVMAGLVPAIHAVMLQDAQPN